MVEGMDGWMDVNNFLAWSVKMGWWRVWMDGWPRPSASISVGLWAEWGPLSATPPTPEPGGGGANACPSAEEEVHTIPYLHLRHC